MNFGFRIFEIEIHELSVTKIFCKVSKKLTMFQRKIGLYKQKDKPLSEVKLPALAAIGPAVSGRLPDEVHLNNA